MIICKTSNDIYVFTCMTNTPPDNSEATRKLKRVLRWQRILALLVILFGLLTYLSIDLYTRQLEPLEFLHGDATRTLKTFIVLAVYYFATITLEIIHKKKEKWFVPATDFVSMTVLAYAMNIIIIFVVYPLHLGRLPGNFTSLLQK